MKKIFLIPAVFVLVAATSCKKKRTCTCTGSTTVVDTYPNGFTDTDIYTSSSTVTAEKQTKKYFRMNNGCYSYTSKITDNNSGATRTTTEDVSCTLK